MRDFSQKIALRYYRNQTLALVLAGVMTGCATLNPPDKYSDKQLHLSQYATLTSAGAVKTLEHDYLTESTSDIPKLAPEHYSTAREALDEAKTLLKKNGSRDAIVRKVAVGHIVLRDATQVASTVKHMLSDELSLKNKLDSLETNEIYRTEYGALQDRLNKLIRNVEAGKVAQADNREKLLKDMQKLEQKAQRYNAMHEPEEILRRVKYSGGAKLAPLTYKEAMDVYKRADQFIKQNPTYEVGIKQIGQEALFAAKRALYITQEVAALKEKFEMSPEQIVLDEEYRLLRVSREINNDDFRDQPLEVQSEMLAKAASAEKQELKNKDGLVLALRDTIIKVRDSFTPSGLKAEDKKLKAEKNEWIAKDALYKGKIKDLEEQLALATKQLDETQQKLLATAGSQQTDNKELEKAKANIKKLKEQLATANAKLKSNDLQMASSAKNKDKLSNDLQVATRDLQNSKKETEQLKAQLAKTKQQLADVQQKSSTTTANKNKIAQNLDAYKKKSKALEKQIADAKQKLQVSQHKIDSLNAKQTQLNSQLELANNQSNKFQQQLKQAQKKLKTAEIKAKTSSDDFKKLTAKLEKLKKAQQQLKQQVAQSNKALKTTKQNAKQHTDNEAQLAQNLKKAHNQIARLNQQLESAKKNNKKAEKELQIAKQNAEKAKQAETVAQEKNDKLAQQVVASRESSRVTKAQALQAVRSAKELLKDIKTDPRLSTNSLDDEKFVNVDE